MKGRISKELESVLRDPAAREQLRNRLIHGSDGRVSVGPKSFSVQTSVQSATVHQKVGDASRATRR